MRTVAVAIALLVVTPVLGFIVIVCGMLGVKDTPNGIYQKASRWWAASICAAAGARIRVFGSEFEPPPGASGAVFCSNHVSWFDVLALAAVVRQYAFIAKRELGDIFIFGRASRYIGTIFIDRQNRKEAFSSYEEAAGKIRSGKSVIVCPEGTRGYDYSLRPFKKGPFVLAISAGVPVIPTVVYGAREVQRKGKMAVRGGVVNIHYLEPIATAGMSYQQRHELMMTVWQRMSDFLREHYGVESSGGPLTKESAAVPIPSSFF